MGGPMGIHRRRIGLPSFPLHPPLYHAPLLSEFLDGLCCCYLYESFEAVLDAEFVEKGKAAPGPLGWEGVPEPKLDSLIGDPLMSLLGLLTAKMLRVCFSSEDHHGLFPSEKGSALRRAFLFGTFAVPSFFLLNWDPVLKNHPEGWTKENPLPPWGFRLG